MPTLSFGLSRAIPEGVNAAWGARLIEPADLVVDRIGLWPDDGPAIGKLLAWLNGGALDTARARLRKEHPLPQSELVVTLLEDGTGKIVASTSRSFGYVYLAAWLIVKRPSPNAAEQLRELVEADELADADDVSGATDCPEGCFVEPDGSCPHGYESAAITLGVI